MNKKVVTYSLLAYINDQQNQKSNLDQIFIPLVKRSLSKMCTEGKVKGNELKDIQKYIDSLYGLEMPDPLLKRILKKIEMELNSPGDEKVKFFSEGAYLMKPFAFNDYEEIIAKRSEELERLQKFYQDFLEAEGMTKKNDTIFKFVEKNKISLGKYIRHDYNNSGYEDYSIEARFVDFIKRVPELFSVLQSIYIGSIISVYLEYQPTDVKANVELVMDTNFIVSMLDLNTQNSKTTCDRLLEIGKRLGYSFTVLGITLREVDSLLYSFAERFDNSFLAAQVDRENIYNACKRRGLTKTDLERIRMNLADDINKLNISIIHDFLKYENKAKYGDEIERLKEIRNTAFAALHDATLLEYVKEKRKKVMYDFEKTPCWILNNTSSRATYNPTGGQPYAIKAEDLLSMLWISSPMVKSGMNNSEFSTIGLSRLISVTLDDSLPNTQTIQKLDENFRKYAKGNISEDDLIKVSNSVAERSVKNLQELNELAASDAGNFVKVLKAEANKQREREENREKLFDKFISEWEEKSRKIDEKIRELSEKEAALERRKLEQEVTANLEYKQKVTELNKQHEQAIKEKELHENEKNKIKEKQVVQVKQLNEFKRKELEKYYWKKVFWWRFWSFLLILIGPIVVVGAYYILYRKYEGNVEWNVALFKENPLLTGLAPICSLVYSGIFIKIFTDKFSRSNVDAFRGRQQIPDHLQIEE